MRGGPVVLLGAPRSGTTVLFEALGRSSGLWSLGTESHGILEGPFHPSLRGWSSNALGADDLDGASAERLRAAFLENVQPGDLWRAKERRRAGGRGPAYGAARVAVLVRRRAGRVRVLEKTPKNCLRIPFLRALFPDATFVFLRRDARPTISSLMDGWREPGIYETYDVPVPLRIAGYGGSKWCFVLPPGWRDLATRPLEEVCALQWRACAEGVIGHLPALRAAGAVHEIAYEDMVARPREVIGGVLERLGLPWEDAILPDDGRLRVVNATSAPDPEKWRRRNGPAVERVLPLVADAQRALGYPA